ncbi:MAG: LPS export ABC transporter periplasmic protein LptC [Ahrensia sp.]|nr:LPS export ABC transporter periplasmic protein LptC [Ahrensia sp.]
MQEQVANRRDARDFRRARRHSLMVRMMRFALPTAALVSTAGFVAIAAVSFVPMSNFSIGNASLQDGRLVMETPKMAGFDAQKRPYEVKANRAIQDLTKPEIIDLEVIDADLPMDAASYATLAADEGTYDSDAETLQLRGNIAIRGARGMDIDMISADIDVRGGSMVSGEPVKVVSENSKILADAVDVHNNGKRIVFRNNVRVTITQPVKRGESTVATSNNGGDIQQ